LATGFAYDIRTNPLNNLAQASRLSLHSQGVRRLGSAALDISYVANGRLDGFWELQLQIWDFAAAALIACEAGGRVTNAHGDSGILVAPYSILAANAQLHPQILKLLWAEA
jgi:myo-inositol-1(or 4)-monophosphatase